MDAVVDNRRLFLNIFDRLNRIDRQSFGLSCKRIAAKQYSEIGKMYYLNVDFIEAVEAYSRSVVLDSRNAAALHNRGVVHYRMGRFGLAEEDFKCAIRLAETSDDRELYRIAVQFLQEVRRSFG